MLAWPPRPAPRPARARPIVAVVDAGDHVAGGDVLVVGDRNGGDVAGDLGRDRELPRGDEGVVGRPECSAGRRPSRGSPRRRARPRPRHRRATVRAGHSWSQWAAGARDRRRPPDPRARLVAGGSRRGCSGARAGARETTDITVEFLPSSRPAGDCGDVVRAKGASIACCSLMSVLRD